MLLTLFETVAPLFLCAGLGYAWGRFRQPYDSRIITRLVSLIGAPCLIFSTLSELDDVSGDIGEIALAAICALACFAVLGALVLRFSGLPMRTFLAPLTFTNTGNLGIPLCLFAYGEPGLALAIGFFAVTATLQLTLGQWLYSGASSLAPLAKAPIPYAVGLGVLFMLTDLEVPTFLASTTELLGGFAIPLMIITLGVSLAEMRVVRVRRTVGLSLARLAIGVAVGFGLAAVFDFEGVKRGVLIILCAMPPAIFNFLFAKYYDNHPEDIASLVMLSTLITFVLLPLLLYVVL